MKKKYRPSVLPIAVIYLVNCVITLVFLFFFFSPFLFSFPFTLTSEVKSSSNELLVETLFSSQPKDCHPSLRFKEEREQVPWHSQSS